MSNNSENIGKNSNKITVLNISGKRKDKDLFKKILKQGWIVLDYSNKNLSNCSARQLIRKIENSIDVLQPYISKILIFENINFEVIQIIGDEIQNMILDIHFNKINKCIRNEQINSYFKLLRKI